MKNILIINAGSSSVKYQLIDVSTEEVIAKGICERIGIEGSIQKHSGINGETKIQKPMPTHNEAIKMILDALTNAEYGVIKNLSEILAVGHRVVHGGEDFTSSVLIDEANLKKIESNNSLAPLHNPPNIMGIRACQAAIPNAPQVAVFDTAFHSTMPDYAFMYGIDYDDYKNHKIRRYGFHGTSHYFVSNEAINYCDAKKIVSCHLGNGASIAAVKDGKCVDTSMGLTPLEGLVMGTRVGDIDAAAIEFLSEQKGLDIKQVTNYLNKNCGVLGVSGVSSDFRDLLAANEAGNKRAELAINMFSYRVRKYIGAYAAAMNGLDCIVFTGGVGENTELVRQKVCEGLTFLGLKIDKFKNNHAPRGQFCELSTEDSKVRVLIIPTNEELVIARETLRLI